MKPFGKYLVEFGQIDNDKELSINNLDSLRAYSVVPFPMKFVPADV